MSDWFVVTLAMLAAILAPILAPMLVIVLLALLALFAPAALRRRLILAPLLNYIRRVLPPLSQTEETALAAGTVWWEAELFRGAPDWQRLLALPAPRLAPAERAFLDGPVEIFCRSLDDWRMQQELDDLPPQAWQFLKEQRFFGLTIPAEYGGLGYSPLAHSAVVMKIASRSISAAVTVMVPNSLGPAELLLHYGTPAQRRHYLPRLARGEEVPCFALTAPGAGSDAAAIADYGIVCRGQHQGREVLGFRLNWDKRYITLAPVATLLGLAFKARDPDGLLSGPVELGITCALIPVGTPGVEIGARHRPMDAVFQNGPTRGRDVFIPLDGVIGGRDGIGRGWGMLMECLSAGRGISLPALGAGSGQLASLTAGSYARIRSQFNVPIGRFEGVAEALARIAGLTYLMDACRLLTMTALLQGERPAVVSALVKHFNTESMRRVLNDAMDVHGGRGICDGPANYLARHYNAIPIGITVEGANILTRSLIVFGQGALRCHPYLRAELTAAQQADRAAGLVAFDKAFLAHLGYTLRNAARAFLHAFTGARFARAPAAGGELKKYYRRLTQTSAAFALTADIALLLLGGGLKRAERLSGRFADVLTALFTGSAALKHHLDGGQRAEELPLAHWALRHSLYQAQVALDEILRNFPRFWVGQMLRALIFPWGRRLRPPNDRLSAAVARCILEPGAARDRLTAGIFRSQDPADPIGRLEHAYALALAAEPAEAKLRAARSAPAPGQTLEDWLAQCIAAGTVSAGEARAIAAARAAIDFAIAVDEFPAAPAAADAAAQAATQAARSTASAA